MVRTLLFVATLTLGAAFIGGCNNCCEPNPCDPCASPCGTPAAAPAAAPAAGCGGSGKGCG